MKPRTKQNGSRFLETSSSEHSLGSAIAFTADILLAVKEVVLVTNGAEHTMRSFSAEEPVVVAIARAHGEIHKAPAT